MTYLIDNNIHLAFVQETWLRKSDGNLITEIKEYGYDIISYRKPRRLDLGGGVALIYKNNLKVQNTKLSHYGSFEHMTCKVTTESGPMTFVNIYRPEYTKKHRYTVKKFISEFTEMLSVIQGDSSSYVVVGDLNLHVELVQGENPLNANVIHSTTVLKKFKDAKSFLTLLCEHNFQQLVNKSTHEAGGTLDLVMAQKEIHSLLSKVEICDKDEVCKSDHFALKFDINVVPYIEDKTIEITKRDYSNLDVAKFCNEIKAANLLEKFPSLTLNQCVTLYCDTLIEALDRQCPSVEIKVRSRPGQKWYNSDLRELKRKRRSVERKFKKYRTTWWKGQLKTINDEYKMAINNTRTTFNKIHLELNKSDRRKIHNTVNYLTGDKQSTIYPSCDNKLQLANDMTKYFSAKIQSIHKDISDCNANLSSLPNPYPLARTKSTITEFTDIDNGAFQAILKEMNTKPHPNDPVPVWLLNSCKEYLFPILLYIANRSLKESVFPDQLKHAVVRPIIKDKNGNKDEYKNYRPVSNLTFLSKLIEKCANSQLQAYLQTNNLYPKYQSAYRKGHSCETALLKVVNDIQKEISSRNMVAMMLLDLSSAFDTIDHSVLLNKLNKDFGISGSVLEWIKSYLSNRTFAVRISNIEGQPVILIFGVPQGSILGPLLFVLYIGDVVNIAKNHGFNAHLYADDCELYISFDPLIENTSNTVAAQSCFRDIKVWMQTNFLKLNVDKTQVIFFGRSQELNMFDAYLRIDRTYFFSDKGNDVKSLGIILDSELKMEKMVSQCIKTCYFNLKKLQTIRNSLDKDLKLTLVTSSILSRIDYCNVLLANSPDMLIKRLQKVLNACIRFIYNIPISQSTTPYLKQCHILPVKQRIKYKSCVLMYQIINNLSPDYLSNMAFPDIGNRDNLRSSNDLLRMKLPDCTKCIQYAMTVNWNELPTELRCLDTLFTFKKQLKTHFFISAFGNFY